MSRMLLRTLRDDPADADAAGHALLVRAGYVRRLASGVYTFLPLGWRVLRQVEAVIRRELDAFGLQEMLMPALSPLELWEQSGRAALFGHESLPAFTVEGRGGTFVLGPTHEEVVTVTVGAEVDSYRQLPQIVYQIQTKFRDEPRPRFGLMRTRELIMADAYSFDASKDTMGVSYRQVLDAYLAIFERLHLDVTPVEAQSGAIGGDVNHEFMVASAVGEDHFVRCPSCGYAANIEAAERAVAVPRAEGSEDPVALAEHHTPGRAGIDDVVVQFAAQGLGPADFLKCLAVLDDAGRPAVVLVPGDREVRLPARWRLFTDDDFTAHPELVRGYIGPMGLAERGVRVVADESVRQHPGPWATGANRTDHHVTGARLGRDFTVDEWGSFAVVEAGDRCPRCEAPLELVRSVEAAHTFQLGLTYSSKLPGATFLDEQGQESPLWMGCYGMGVSRLLAVLAEEHHDDRGLVWPDEVAPFALHLVAVGAERNPDVRSAAEELYDGLLADGVAVLYDDRELSAGVKFADADLLGIPVRVVLGAKGVARGVAEWRRRDGGGERDVPLAVARAELAG
ncbi:MAG TPA: proline--tRNA ligase [Acidimicrobiales bacterium]|nr:proline--tRNA ligase [Acidimicrobiales bacterium]